MRREMMCRTHTGKNIRLRGFVALVLGLLLALACPALSEEYTFVAGAGVRNAILLFEDGGAARQAAALLTDDLLTDGAGMLGIVAYREGEYCESVGPLNLSDDPSALKARASDYLSGAVAAEARTEGGGLTQAVNMAQSLLQSFGGGETSVLILLNEAVEPARNPSRFLRDLVYSGADTAIVAPETAPDFVFTLAEASEAEIYPATDNYAAAALQALIDLENGARNTQLNAGGEAVLTVPWEGAAGLDVNVLYESADAPEIRLTDPEGNPVEAEIASGEGYRVLHVKNPMAGEWRVAVSGVEAPVILPRLNYAAQLNLSLSLVTESGDVIHARAWFESAEGTEIPAESGIYRQSEANLMLYAPVSGIADHEEPPAMTIPMTLRGDGYQADYTLEELGVWTARLQVGNDYLTKTYDYIASEIAPEGSLTLKDADIQIRLGGLVTGGDGTLYVPADAKDVGVIWQVGGEPESANAELLMDGQVIREGISQEDMLDASTLEVDREYELRVTAMPNNGTNLGLEPVTESVRFQLAPDVIPVEGVNIDISPRFISGGVCYVDQKAQAATFSWRITGESEEEKAELSADGEVMIADIQNGDQVPIDRFREGVNYTLTVSAMPKNGALAGAEPFVQSQEFRLSPKLGVIEDIEIELQPGTMDENILYLDRNAESYAVDWTVTGDADLVVAELIAGNVALSQLEPGQALHRDTFEDDIRYGIRVRATPKNGRAIGLRPTTRTLYFQVAPAVVPVQGIEIDLQPGSADESMYYFNRDAEAVTPAWTVKGETDEVTAEILKGDQVLLTLENGESVPASAFMDGETYTLRVSAMPLNGKKAGASPTVEELTFQRYPEASVIEGLTLSVPGATQRGEAWQFEGDSAEVTWTLTSGEVNYYVFKITDSQGQAVSASDFDDAATGAPVKLEKNGDYTVELTAVPKFGRSADQNVTASLTIRPHIKNFFEKYWYFFAAGAGLLLLILLLILLLRKGRKGKKAASAQAAAGDQRAKAQPIEGVLHVYCEDLELDKTITFDPKPPKAKKGEPEPAILRAGDALSSHPDFQDLKGTAAYKQLAGIRLSMAKADQNGDIQGDLGGALHKPGAFLIGLNTTRATGAKEVRYVGAEDDGYTRLHLRDSDGDYEFLFWGLNRPKLPEPPAPEPEPEDSPAAPEAAPEPVEEIRDDPWARATAAAQSSRIALSKPEPAKVSLSKSDDTADVHGIDLRKRESAADSEAVTDENAAVPTEAAFAGHGVNLSKPRAVDLSKPDTAGDALSDNLPKPEEVDLSRDDTAGDSVNDTPAEPEENGAVDYAEYYRSFYSEPEADDTPEEETDEAPEKIDYAEYYKNFYSEPEAQEDQSEEGGEETPEIIDYAEYYKNFYSEPEAEATPDEPEAAKTDEDYSVNYDEYFKSFYGDSTDLPAGSDEDHPGE